MVRSTTRYFVILHAGTTMPRRALSKSKRKQGSSEFLNKWIDIAATRYREGQNSEGGGPKKGVRKICREVAEECFQETKKRVELSKTTVIERSKGRISIREFNAGKGWLTPEEEDVVVDFAIDTALRGFPLNHQRLKERVDEICQAKLGNKFPESGVGKEWTQRFVDRHSQRLKPYWSRALDKARARAVNPHNVDAYFKLLKEAVDGGEGEEPIPPECIYGMDETGLQEGVAVAERVIGPVGNKVQYQQRSGERENITVVVAICADGSSEVPPAVIFKGEAYQAAWQQDNPVNAS